jgi:hypothetical protein
MWKFIAALPILLQNSVKKNLNAVALSVWKFLLYCVVGETL